MNRLGRLTSKDYREEIFPSMVSMYESEEIDFFTFCNWCRTVETTKDLLISYLRNKDVLKITRSERGYLVKESLDFDSELRYKLVFAVHSLYSSQPYLENLCMCLYLGYIWAVDYGMCVDSKKYLQDYYKAGGKKIWA